MRPTTLLTDFDNTLYDWFGMWHASFSAMVEEIAKISGLDEKVLYPEIRVIHQKYRTSEYAFLIEEIPSLKALYPDSDLTKVFDKAIHAYRSARKRSLVLYEGVRETLSSLRSKGVLIAIYTESRAYYTNYRIRKLGLDDLVDVVFSPPDHEIPLSAAAYNLGGSDGTNRLLHARHVFLPPGVLKPNPEVLLDIVKEIGRRPLDCVYVGDSLMKDVAMAQDAGVADVLAEYGVVQHHLGYDLLRKVSHWSEEDVQREKAVSKSRSVTPTHIIDNFSQIDSFF
jgi:FMN phosphatase YigB (HAD superfamily)